ncbi:MAG: type I-C CRISPR-associated protein Cas8c/Csd1 [Rhodocyclaceae bacterium]|nr:type I-C CRISPR-associated protein Cas8c/Csd1 [Rhodocyclaceae bacterium]MCA3145650.1 type I-C CRISPR-associated protein Cas8c/Csd1 [Rhodocyclaceae bacterium]
MILRALVDYYERRQRSTDPARRLPAAGFEDKAIPFLIEIDRDGRVLQLLDTRQLEGKQLRAQVFLVPQGEKKTSGVKANLLWDSAEYVIALPRERKSTGDVSPAQAFRQRLERLPEPARSDLGIQACLAALDRSDWSVLHAHPAWSEIEQANPVMTFALAGDGSELVCQRPAVVRAALTPEVNRTTSGWCLVDGQQGPIARLHPSIKGVKDAQTSGANIVSFNARAFESYGKTERQGENAPVGEHAVFAYTTALNALLLRNSPNKLQIADATTVIWADRDDSIEPELVALFGDDPDAHVDAVKQRLAGASAGAQGALDRPLRFFVLGLAPNASRIAVRFWFNDTFDRLAPRILQHFDDLRIVRQGERDAVTPPMYWLLRSVAAQGKPENVPPRLAGDWLRAILEGGPYPPALLNAAVNRCRAEQTTDAFGGNVPYLRAAILKACVNREYRRRYGKPIDFQFIHEELDVNQTDPAYRLGRLFAVLERIQSAAQPNINATIRDRYYGAASSTPGAVFPTLLRLKNAHLKKLSPGMENFFEKLIGDVCGSVENPALADFPRQLDLQAQGLFALGYYQQRQSLNTRKDGPADSVHTVQEN